MAPLESPGTDPKFEEVFQSRGGLSGFTVTVVFDKGSFTSGRKFKLTELCGNYWKMIEITRSREVRGLEI